MRLWILLNLFVSRQLLCLCVALSLGECYLLPMGLGNTLEKVGTALLQIDGAEVQYPLIPTDTFPEKVGHQLTLPCCL